MQSPLIVLPTTDLPLDNHDTVVRQGALKQVGNKAVPLTQPGSISCATVEVD